MSTPAARRLSAGIRREQLLEVAETLFTERGFEEVGMNDVAQALGTSRPTVYSYFTSTGEILRALLDARLPLLWERLDPLLPGQTGHGLPEPAASVPGSPPVAAEQADHYSEVFRALIGERELLLLHSGGGPTFRLERDRFLTRLAEGLAPGQPRQRGEVTALLLEAAALQALRHPGRDTSGLARILGSFVAGGLAALQAES